MKKIAIKGIDDAVEMAKAIRDWLDDLSGEEHQTTVLEAYNAMETAYYVLCDLQNVGVGLTVDQRAESSNDVD